VELVATISSLEIVNANHLKVKVSGKVPTIQIDLSQDVEITMNSANAAETRLVNASAVDIYIIIEDLELKYKVPTSLFSDQFVSRINAQHKLMTLPTKGMEKDGIVEIARL
jgi:hypothetical protein